MPNPCNFWVPLALIHLPTCSYNQRSRSINNPHRFLCFLLILVDIWTIKLGPPIIFALTFTSTPFSANIPITTICIKGSKFKWLISSQLLWELSLWASLVSTVSSLEAVPVCRKLGIDFDFLRQFHLQDDGCLTIPICFPILLRLQAFHQILFLEILISFLQLVCCTNSEDCYLFHWCVKFPVDWWKVRKWMLLQLLILFSSF